MHYGKSVLDPGTPCAGHLGHQNGCFVLTVNLKISQNDVINVSNLDFHLKRRIFRLFTYRTEHFVASTVRLIKIHKSPTKGFMNFSKAVSVSFAHVIGMGIVTFLSFTIARKVTIVTFLPVMNDRKVTIVTFLPVMNDKKVTIVTFL